MFLRRIAPVLVGAFITISPAAFAQQAFTFSPVGVGSTETVQINVANIASNGADGTAASCTGSIAFSNSSGGPVQVSSGELSVNFSVAAGQSFSVPLVFNVISSPTARAVVIGVISLNAPQAPCSFRYSLETYDTATGATHLFVNNAGGVFGL